MDIPRSQKNISKEVSDFYNTSRNTFYAKDKGEKANEFETEIGDSKQDDFIPQVKLLRWGNEANASFRLIDDEPDTPEIKTEGNKIKFIKNKLEAYFYNTKIEKTDDYEFEIILKEKPKTNKVQMSIESKGLKFYYQPSLKKEHKIGERGAVVITDTDVKDKDGKVICHRPENVVGSYAVYHESKQGDYSKMGKKNYRAGKAFHIYRPKIIDAEGTEVWGKLNITDNLLTVEIPQEFLDNAVYPVIVDPTFGCDPASPGGSNTAIPQSDLYGSLFTAPSDIARTDSLSMYVSKGNDPYYYYNWKGVLVLHSNLNIVTNGVGDEIVGPDPTGWVTSTFSTLPTLTVSTDYVLSTIHQRDDTAKIYYDSGDANQGHYDSSNDYGTPTNPTDATHNNNKYSIYCTYWDAATTESPYIPKGIPKPFRGVQLDKSHPLNRGLVACFLFNEGDGKKVFDLSGNGNHGTLHNMAFPPTAVSGWNAGRKGHALSFDGSNDYVDCGNDSSLDITDAITISAWVKPMVDSSYKIIVAKGKYNDVWEFRIDNSNHLEMYIGADIAHGTKSIVAGNWYHVVTTFDESLPNNNIKLYTNGELDGTPDTKTTPISSSNNSIRIGTKSIDGIGLVFNGQINQVRIYSRALTASEILYLYLHPFG